MATFGSLPAKRRLTVDEYEVMERAGIFNPDEHVELLDGELIEMASMGSRHTGCVSWNSHWFEGRVSGRAIVRGQSAIRLPPFSEPEPDIVLARPRDDFYMTSHPEPADILLLIEVADTSIGLDRRIKLPLYAQAGIREVWIVNLDQRRVEVYREPEPGAYSSTTIYAGTDTFAPLAFPDLILDAGTVLGPVRP